MKAGKGATLAPGSARVSDRDEERTGDDIRGDIEVLPRPYRAVGIRAWEIGPVTVPTR
jgi:hypothetical protein